jgi:hypothetical protein
MRITNILHTRIIIILKNDRNKLNSYSLKNGITIPGGVAPPPEALLDHPRSVRWVVQPPLWHLEVVVATLNLLWGGHNHLNLLL